MAADPAPAASELPIDAATALKRAEARLAALEAEHRRVLATLPALHASLRLAADVAEDAEAALVAANTHRKAAEGRAQRAELCLALVTQQLAAVRGSAFARARPAAA